jgi:hypothetical protein
LEGCSLRPTRAKHEIISKKQKAWCPEFNPQDLKKKKKRIVNNAWCGF